MSRTSAKSRVASTIWEMCRLAFGEVGLDWERYVVADPKFFRLAEVDVLSGDAPRARDRLGWFPKISLEQLTG